MSCFPRYFLLNALSLVAAVVAGAGPATPLPLGSRLEPIVDRYLFERFEGAQLVLGQPCDQGSVMCFDEPWEGQFSLYVSLLRDGPTYRMYYRGWRGQDGADELGPAVTCYAESSDGIAWRKPVLGLHPFDGNKANNIVIPADDRQISVNFSAFLDTRPGVPASERFKGIGGKKSRGLYRMVSEDGIRWRTFRDDPVFAGYALDSQNLALWSPAEQLYAIYLREFTPGNRIRTISRATSKDFVHWTKPIPMEFGGTPMEHLYTNATAPYYRAEHILVALPGRFHPTRQVLSPEELRGLQAHPTQHRGISDAVLMTSRGGNSYDRTFMESFIRPGRRREAWVARNNYPSIGILPTGPGEMSIYTVVNYATPGTHLRRYSLRIDGLAALHAGYEGGSALTWPLIFSGRKLVINCATSAAGAITVEILDQDGKVIPGFEAEACDIIIGDELAREVTWRGNGSLERLSGRPVRLRFRLQDADMYSLQFQL